MPAPPSRRDDVVEEHFGTRVPDPYRWLEDPDSGETRAWVEAQNAHTDELLAIPTRDRIAARLQEVWRYDRMSAPVRESGAWWFDRHEGLAHHPRLFRHRDGADAPELILDPNTFSDDGTRALSSWAASRDGRFLAYAIADGGSDWVRWRVRDLDRHVDLPDALVDSKFSGAAWLPDGTGFLYARYPRPAEGIAPDKHQQIWLHRLGTPQVDDVLVHADPEHPDRGFWTRVSEDGTLLVVSVHVGTDERTHLWVRRLRDGHLDLDLPFERVLDAFDAEYSFVGNRGRTLLVHTDKDAPRRRVIAVDLDHPERERWREIVPEGEDTLAQVSLVGGRLLCRYLHHATARIEVRDIDTGALLAEVPLPGPGSVDGLHGHQDHDHVYFRFTSFAHPASVWRYDAASGALSLHFRPDVPIDLADTHTEQIFVESRDGTRVPAFVTWRGERPTDGQRPTLLYGYGGFDIPVLPAYDPRIAVWLELGGAWVVANLRGGGEYGREWHEAGTKLRKQNVFDDFVDPSVWRSMGAATAACWSARACCSGRTCSGRRSPRSACSTCCATSAGPSAGRGPPTTAPPTRARRCSARSLPTRRCTTSGPGDGPPPW